MGYDTTISFTLDTICPWTYIARKRLSTALAQVKQTHPDATFHIHINPYQLHPDAPATGEDKYQWYLHNKYNSDSAQMEKYTTYMTALGLSSGINFKFGGTIASTLDAHRVIQWSQEKHGKETAGHVVESLYRQYFEEERHPSSAETLLKATGEAGISEGEARAVVEGEEGLREVKRMIGEQKGNGVDAVPYIVVEGKRRDFTLEGAKEVEEYVKTLEQVIKESN